MIITGVVKENPKAKKSLPEGYEIGLSSLQVLQICLLYTSRCV